MNELEKYMRMYNTEKEWRLRTEANLARQISDMQKLLNESSRIIDNLKDQNDKLSNTYSNYYDKYIKAEALHRDANSLIRERNERINSLKNDLQANEEFWRGREQKLLVTINQLSRQQDKLIEETKKLSESNDELRKNRNIHLNRKLKLYDERKDLNSEITELKDEIKHLNATVNRQASTIIQYQNDLRNLKSSVQPDQRSGINPNYPSCTPGWGQLGGTASPIGHTHNKKPRVKIVWDDYDIGG